MYKINQLKLPVGFELKDIKNILAKKLKQNPENIEIEKLLKLSIDSRDKNDICYKASVVFNSKFLDLKKLKDVELYKEEELITPKWNGGDKKIIIVGSGPSGLFAGMRLADCGAKFTILERGYEMAKRQKAVDMLMEKGVLDTVSNIQFGEGGAGTFSDGKLNTGIKSKHINYVLETFYKFGADEDILYDSKPHVGTDILSKVIVNMRKYLTEQGNEFFFEHKLIGINTEEGVIKSITVETPEGVKSMECDILILAIGHSSRDTIRMLFNKNIEFKQKAFSMGFRIEHLRGDINKSQYGESDIAKKLPAADYHLVEHLDNGRVAYTFCMCPGGVVVPAMSEEGTIVTNGMSYSGRNLANSNSALLVGINTDDFPSSHPLSGIEMQEKWEKYAYKKTGCYFATVQRVGDFLESRPTLRLGKVKPSFTPNFKLGSVEDMMPEFVIDTLKKVLPRLDKKLHGFADPDAILTGVETRTSAPYQIIRNDNMETCVSGVYAVGEGAGFAGGIVSSAVDGIKCVDNICLFN